ncbi:MAG: hypothetical protein KatS3mg111_1004 [Pirellulaceae bacterium]|nr:MAG: hypothetical protein KatS3mg111_1004 [Pirellulaceae bacterium]
MDGKREKLFRQWMTACGRLAWNSVVMGTLAFLLAISLVHYRGQAQGGRGTEPTVPCSPPAPAAVIASMPEGELSVGMEQVDGRGISRELAVARWQVRVARHYWQHYEHRQQLLSSPSMTATTVSHRPAAGPPADQTMGEVTLAGGQPDGMTEANNAAGMRMELSRKLATAQQRVEELTQHSLPFTAAPSPHRSAEYRSEAVGGARHYSSPGHPTDRQPLIQGTATSSAGTRAARKWLSPYWLRRLLLFALLAGVAGAITNKLLESHQRQAPAVIAQQLTTLGIPLCGKLSVRDVEQQIDTARRMPLAITMSNMRQAVAGDVAQMAESSLWMIAVVIGLRTLLDASFRAQWEHDPLLVLATFWRF